MLQNRLNFDFFFQKFEHKNKSNIVSNFFLYFVAEDKYKGMFKFCKKYNKLKTIIVIIIIWRTSVE